MSFAANISITCLFICVGTSYQTLDTLTFALEKTSQ